MTIAQVDDHFKAEVTATPMILVQLEMFEHTALSVTCEGEDGAMPQYVGQTVKFRAETRDPETNEPYEAMYGRVQVWPPVKDAAPILDTYMDKKPGSPHILEYYWNSGMNPDGTDNALPGRYTAKVTIVDQYGSNWEFLDVSLSPNRR